MIVFSPGKSRGIVPLIIFIFCLIFPSIGVVLKYAGLAGLIIYFVAVPVFLFIGAKLSIAIFRSISESQGLWLVLATFVVLTGLFVVTFPLAHSGKFGGGSDGAQAIDLAISELLHGRYPYYPKTYLGNPISPMPGSLFFAIPFVLLGNGAYQNIFWLFMLFLTIKAVLGDQRLALAMLWSIFVLSPGFLQKFVVGSDYIANAIFVLLLIYWLVTAVPKPEVSVARKVILALLLGIGLSSRANFLLVTPLVFSLLVQKSGWKKAIGYSGVIAIAFAVVTLPFYLYDPSGFAPLHTSDILGQFQAVLPYAGVVIPLATGLLAAVLSASNANKNTFLMLRNAAIVTALPIFIGVVLSSIQSARLDGTFFFFGVLMMFFGLLYSWGMLFESNSQVGNSVVQTDGCFVVSPSIGSEN